ncbi:alpha/beta hydrolase family esterase [Hydrotalea sandarakina]|uniref:Polyhydroxybutyrate depolymerase n=1 Tax=Hydrotalea sandarakina TaxID=1004304 RepID=A0A2W7RRF7_9BACT|nr:alpha/beta fold hydrolase [Hydrotalea sandarakina]PZX62924.1 polyhydroxybutyrate depolymerase [Hydrotalea sandarakina]
MFKKLSITTYRFLGIIVLCLYLKPAVSQTIRHTIMVDGRERNFLVYIPEQYANAQNLKVIIALHGGGGTAENTEQFYRLNPEADRFGYMVVYPNAINKAWNFPGTASRVKKLDTTVNDVHFMNALIDTLIARYHINKAHVFFTGMSRGAMFSLYLATALNHKIAAIAAVCGSISEENATDYHFDRPIPALIINGTADPLVPYNGGYGKWNRNNFSESANFIATPKLIQLLLQQNHCVNESGVTVQIPNKDPLDGCTANETKYKCSSAPVESITIQNGGHTWPGSSQYLPKIIVGRVCKDFSAAEKIVLFFNAVP